MALAMIIDWIFGEPPERFHPTVWMGKYIATVKSLILKTEDENAQKLMGAGLAVSAILTFAVPTYVIENVLLGPKGTTTYVFLSAIILKTTFAVKCMHQLNTRLSTAIENERLEEARKQLTVLVRRDPWKLDEKQMISASVETIAEGIVDGAVSPLFYFSIFGLPGAVTYRVINTLDSMVGYKDPIHRDLGFFSAKLDTVANYVPARIAALLLVFSALAIGENHEKSLEILRRDHYKTESFNAGWSMSAMAGALNVQLEKRDHYRLGDEIEALSTKHISRALRMHLASILLFLISTTLPLTFLTSNMLGDIGIWR